MAEKNAIVTEDFIECWSTAGHHLQRMAGDNSLSWMRATLDIPFMEHLSFRLGNQLFFVRIEDADKQNEIPGNEQDLLTIAKACNGHACVMPMRFAFGRWICAERGWGLLSAQDRQPIDPLSLVTDEKIEMTDWELHDFAVQVARQHLIQEGEQITGCCSNPNLQPSMWLGGEPVQWVYVQAVRYPQEAEIPQVIHQIDEKYRAKNFKGNFLYVRFSNQEQDPNEPLKPGEKVMPIYRGEKAFITCSGLLDINN